jgi:hypothetical protein
VGAADDARTLGGAIGCNRDTYSSDPLLEVGHRYVFFLRDDQEPRHTDSDTMIVGAAWTVASDGDVKTPLDGTSDLGRIQDVLTRVPLMTR